MPAASSPTIDKGDPSQEAILQTIIDYVYLDAPSDQYCKPVASMLFVHAGGGTDFKAIVRTIRKPCCEARDKGRRIPKSFILTLDSIGNALHMCINVITALVLSVVIKVMHEIDIIGCRTVGCGMVRKKPSRRCRNAIQLFCIVFLFFLCLCTVYGTLNILNTSDKRRILDVLFEVIHLVHLLLKMDVHIQSMAESPKLAISLPNLVENSPNPNHEV